MALPIVRVVASPVGSGCVIVVLGVARRPFVEACLAIVLEFLRQTVERGRTKRQIMAERTSGAHAMSTHGCAHVVHTHTHTQHTRAHTRAHTHTRTHTSPTRAHARPL